MKKLTISLSLAMLAVFFLFFAAKSTGLRPVSHKSDIRKKFVVNFVPAKTSNELAAIRTNRSANIIRSKNDVDRILATFQSPLSLLSSEDLAQFKSKLVERTGVGIVSLQYSAVKSKLSKKDFETLMAMFGFDTEKGFWGLSSDPIIINQIRASSMESAGKDYDGYYCTGPKTCYKTAGYICTSNC